MTNFAFPAALSLAAALLMAAAPAEAAGSLAGEIVATPGARLAFVDAPSYGVGRIKECDDAVIVRESADHIVLENRHLRATLGRNGRLLSLIHKPTGRETLAGPGNQLLLYVDEPNAWDAWDVDPQHMETEKPCGPAESH